MNVKRENKGHRRPEISQKSPQQKDRRQKANA